MDECRGGTTDGNETSETLHLESSPCGIPESMRKARSVPVNFLERTCPIIPTNYYRPSPSKLQAGTTYKLAYTPKAYEVTNSFKPHLRYSTGMGIIEGPTEYKQAFVAFPVEPYRKPEWAEKEQFKPVEYKLSGISSYRAAFQYQYSRPAQLLRPKHYKDPNPGPMRDLTTYRVEYVPQKQEKVCSMKPILPPPATSIPPFRGITMYNSSYLPFCRSSLTKSYKFRSSFPRREYEFQNETTYSENYRPFAFKKCNPPINEIIC